ncbi:MAG: carboxypeptidase regulatory-like domain-containing protein [Candidatus Acidiferrales bacterium]|jgi:hypothetical protein
MKKIFLALNLAVLCAVVSHGQTKANEPAKDAAHAAAAQASAATEENASAKLPVRRVVLYKNGVGYFEHLGRVRGNQDVHIDFTSGQLNDALESLTVLDLSGGRINGVDYNSEAPLARRLASLRLALGEKPTVAEFLGALRGARLEVKSGGASITGRLLSVERKTRTGTNWAVETDVISLVTDGGEVHTVELSPAATVRIAEHDLQIEVGKYLGLVASAREQDLRRMTISTAGTGERNLYVSYISEVPIWKTTYRIVLPSKPEKKPLLQGWAIIDNTVGEDWNDVELSLVAGAPHSFIQPLSQPYYGRRPVVPLPESAQLTPQTHAATLISGSGQLSGVVTDAAGAVIPGTTVKLLDENDNQIAETSADGAGRYSFSALSVGSYSLRLMRSGFKDTLFRDVNIAPGGNRLDAQLQVGSVAETVTVEASALAVQTSSAEVSGVRASRVANRPHVLAGGVGSGMGGGTGGGAFRAGLSPASLEAARTLMEAAASGQGLGDLFEYKLKDRVTLKKNKSALVPIVQTDVAAEKVSLWNGTSGAGRPLRALWLTNTSALTLDGGSFAVLEDEAFAGEGLADPIKPGERRLISYATDLGLQVESKLESKQQHVLRVKIVHGMMTQTREEREQNVYIARNEDTKPRMLVIEHPARSGWKLDAEAPAPEEQTADLYRFRVNVAPKHTERLTVQESQTLETQVVVTNLNDDQIAFFSKEKSINAEVEQALRKIVAQKNVLAKLQAQINARGQDVNRIVQDQGRLRENMKALKGTPEEKALTQRYTQELDRQETDLANLRKEIQGLEAQRDKEKEKLDTMVEELALDATL